MSLEAELLSIIDGIPALARAGTVKARLISLGILSSEDLCTFKGSFSAEQGAPPPAEPELLALVGADTVAALDNAPDDASAKLALRCLFTTLMEADAESIKKAVSTLAARLQVGLLPVSCGGVLLLRAWRRGRHTW